MKTYQEIRETHLRDLGKSSSGGFALFGVVVVFAAVIIVFSFFNTASMQSVSTANAKEYVSELTVQTAGTVSTDVSDKKTSLSSIAESLRLHFDDGLEETNTDEYVRDHLTSLYSQTKFDFLICQRIDAEVIYFGELPEDLPDLLEGSAFVVQEAEEKNECVAYIQNGTILYAVPVFSGGQIIGTLIAGVSSAALDNLMQSQIYQTQASFCLTNREGKLLVASEDARFKEAAEVLSPDNQAFKSLIEEMKAAFAAGTGGVVEVKLSDEQNYLLTYEPIQSEDWMIVTLVPTNVFSSAYIAYMKRALAYTISAAIAFVILLALMRLSYKGSRKKLEYLAYTDELTGGINSIDFQMRYGLLKRKANPLEYCVLMLDINDFKLINELGGFSAGDRLIKHTYASIMQTLNEKDYEFACRVEVDHFFVCMHEHTAEGIVRRVAKISELVNAGGEELTQGLHITFGQGACIIDSEDLGIEEITQRARIAKRSASSDQRASCIIYTEEMRHALSLRVQLDYMAEESIKNGDFTAYFQPKVDMSTGAIKGAEALARWNHPNRGLIQPSEFVPVLEESGRIQDVDRCTFEATCRYLSERKAKGEELFPISVNLSRVHFWKDDVISEFAAIADAYHVDHSLLEFEITETVFMEQDKLEKIKEGIRQMHEQGFTCALDDFGVGYSSLSLVNQMDIDTLKFDRSFFMNLDDEKSRKIVLSLIYMGYNLNLDMVVEGIETEEQIEFLQPTKARIIQGYYFSRPLPKDDFEAWVNTHSL